MASTVPLCLRLVFGPSQLALEAPRCHDFGDHSGEVARRRCGHP